MNERINQLAQQADELDYQTFDSYNQTVVQHYKFNKEKFAQLIVQECAKVADGGWADPGHQIKHHFGVEE
jgi:hypothetical protein